MNSRFSLFFVGRRAAWWLAAGSILLAGRLAYPLAAEALASGRTPLWDMARNGRGVAELAADLTRLDLLAFLADLNWHDPWAFGASILWLPFALLPGGSTLATVTFGQATLFALLPGALVWAAWEIEPSAGSAIRGLCAGGLAATSPHLLVQAPVLLREVPGALTTTVALAAFLHARRSGSLGAWRLAWLAVLLVILVKYNYGAILLAALAADAWLRLAPTARPQAMARVLRRLGVGRSATAKSRLLGLALVALAITRLAGYSIGGGAYALLVLTIVSVLWPLVGSPGGALSTAAQRLRSFSPARRAAIECLVVPLAVWFLIPQPLHLRGLLDFLENRSSELGVVDSLAFYPRAFLGGGGAGGGLIGGSRAGTVALLLLVSLGAAKGLGLLSRKPAHHGERTVVLLTLAGGLAAALHPYKEPRFLLTTLPISFLVAGLALTPSDGEPSSPRTGRRARAAWNVVAGLTVLAIVSYAIWRAPTTARYALAAFATHSGDPRLARALEFSRRQAPPVERYSVIGGFNEFSPDLVRWALLPGEFLPLRADRVPEGPFRGGPRWVGAPRRSDHPPGGTASLVDLRLGRWLDRERADAVLVATLTEGSAYRGSADYLAYPAWQEHWAQALSRRPGWRSAASYSDQALGLRLDWMVRVSAGPDRRRTASPAATG